MSKVKAFPLSVHENAELLCVEFDDRFDFKLINKATRKEVEKSYYKLDEGLSIGEAVKIDMIIYFMHNEVDLNLWESKKRSGENECN